MTHENCSHTLAELSRADLNPTASWDSPGLTITEILRLMGRTGDREKRTRSVLSRFLDDPETAALLGASGPVRPTYPSHAVPVMSALLDASERGEVTPKMGAIWLAKHFPATSANEAIPIISGNRELEKSRIDTLGVNPTQEFVLAVQTLVERVPVQDDRLLTGQQAAELLACKSRSVSLYVKPVRRGVYRWSDVMKFISGLRPRGG